MLELVAHSSRHIRGHADGMSDQCEAEGTGGPEVAGRAATLGGEDVTTHTDQEAKQAVGQEHGTGQSAQTAARA